jgi:hypothetical protein
MVKELKKPTKTPTNTMNSILSENKTLPKSRQPRYLFLILIVLITGYFNLLLIL